VDLAKKEKSSSAKLGNQENIEHLWQGRKRMGLGRNAVPCERSSRLPQILPAKVAAAEFALILSMVAGAIVAPALRVAMIDVRVKSFASGVFELLVSDCAKRHATQLGVPVRTRLLISQNGVVFFASDVGALKSDKLVVFRVFNDHAMNRVNVLYNMHLHDFFWHSANHIHFTAV